MTDTLIHPFLRHRHHTPQLVTNMSLTYKRGFHILTLLKSKFLSNKSENKNAYRANQPPVILQEYLYSMICLVP